MQSREKFVVAGTAGHVDHGKTALLKALTGIDTDRLKEEKERGMTIDLGFAFLELPGNIKVGIVDVPGHEKFIRNMLAGAHGIDIVLFVVALDEGVMPETREHLTVCQMLGVKHGIVVLTKKDLVDPEWGELVREEVEEFTKGSFLEGAPVVMVSAKTGEGIDILLKELARTAREVEPKRADGIFRLPVDRSFTVKGFGTVVTGTAISGKVRVGDTLEVLSKVVKVRVRGIQVHGRPVDTAFAGSRTALNLLDVVKEDVGRGDVLATPGYLTPTNLVDVELTISKEADVLVTSGFKVHFGHLAGDTEGEVYLIDKQELAPGESAFAQIRLKGKVVPVYGDRFVVRNYSPPRVIGGGWIVNPLPFLRYRRRFRNEYVEFLNTLKESGEKAILLYIERLPGRFRSSDFVQLLGFTPSAAEKAVESLIRRGLVVSAKGRLYAISYINRLRERALATLRSFHSKYPIAEGINKESLRTTLKVDEDLFVVVLESLQEEGLVEEKGGVLKLGGFTPAPDGSPYGETVERVKSVLNERKFAPPSSRELSELLGCEEETINLVLSYLVNREGYIKVGNLVYSPSAVEELLGILKRHFERKTTLSVGDFKELLGVSRKFAIPLLEFLDAKGFTLRRGNERVKGNL